MTCCRLYSLVMAGENLPLGAWQTTGAIIPDYSKSCVPWSVV